MVLVGPFQFRILCDSIVCYWCFLAHPSVDGLFVCVRQRTAAALFTTVFEDDLPHTALRGRRTHQTHTKG